MIARQCTLEIVKSILLAVVGFIQMNCSCAEYILFFGPIGLANGR